MVAYIDEHRGVVGIGPICTELPIAPSTYYAHKAMQSDPTKQSLRRRRDESLRAEIRSVWDENFMLWGAQGMAPARAREPPAPLIDARSSV